MARHRKPDTDDSEFLRWDIDLTTAPLPVHNTRDDAHHLRDGAGDAMPAACGPNDALAAPQAPALIASDSATASHIEPRPSVPGDEPDSARPSTVRRGAHRRQAPSRHGGRVMVLSVATGALLAAGTSTAHAAPAETAPQADLAPAPPADPVAAALAAAPQVLQIPQIPDLSKFADQLAKAREREAERVAREAAARRPTSIAPVSGTLTSNYGARWGTTHYGLDIANAIGTPIVSVTDGTVLEAGPASGFGLWVRILQDDGTIGVFGHINEALVTAGQKVRAGEQIATVGNRGQSTGPHLHYEVWQADGVKADPMAWLNARGVQIQSPNIRG